jgi:hypothetical protein
MYSSKRDLRRLREWVRSTHDTLLPIGLFVPFEVAWLAVKEFIETASLPRASSGSRIVTFRQVLFLIREIFAGQMVGVHPNQIDFSFDSVTKIFYK